ncbi:MAG: elongation factor Ts [Halobacteriovoraceae bacterium]|nr:elongation factor Ts [Halobacteriovoraceae bacterium]|tara:strand:- start:210 stop:1124 length:915 start_codon:yes stop_codon:yes gene_type:complete
MSFTAKDVKELREKTGAGMMDCKKALTENNGDLEAAVDFLRQKGLAAAAKKATRIAAEGLVGAAVEGNTGAVVEINCETDFVAKNDDFKKFVNQITNHLLSSNASDVEALKAEKMGSNTIQETVQELTLKIGEKIDIRRFEKRSLDGEGKVGSYVHGGKIGVLVEVGAESSDVAKSDAFNELVNDLCLHVAAADPKFMSADDIDEDFKNKEAKVYEAQLKDQGKPENMIPNIVKGKLNKLASEVCLLEQKFVKNPDQSISALVKEYEGKAGGKITLKGFSRVNLGEGIEKKEDNLAEEVAKMTQ